MNHRFPDPNLNTENRIESDVVFYDVREDPFDVYGLYDYRNQPTFKRLPTDVAEATSAGVVTLHTNTAGGRIRFSTDSDYIAIHVVVPNVCHFDNMSWNGTMGCDLYVDDPAIEEGVFCGIFRPGFAIFGSANEKNVYSEGGSYESIFRFSSRKMRYFTINMPSYNDVDAFYVGVREGSSLGHGMKYRNELPVVYYGSSITQGASASHPGNAYENIVSRRFNQNFVNLGFSGRCKGEDAIVNYIASMPMSAFVLDFDHNAPNPDFLREKHLPVYQKVRASHPDIPIILLSKPDVLHQNFENEIKRRDVVIDTFRYARENRDRNVFFIDGESMFRGPYEDCCTADGCHPNDLGFALMADAVSAIFHRAFAFPSFLNE